METRMMEATRTAASTVLVEKRDGRIVDFDAANIINAIRPRSPVEQVGRAGGRSGIADRSRARPLRYAGPAKIEDIRTSSSTG